MKMEEKELAVIEWVEDFYEEDGKVHQSWDGNLKIDKHDTLTAWIHTRDTGGFYFRLFESDYVWEDWEYPAKLKGWEWHGEAATLEETKAMAEVALRHAEAFVNEWEKLDEQDFPNHSDRSSNYTRFLFEIKKPALEAYAKMLEEYKEVEEDED